MGGSARSAPASPRSPSRPAWTHCPREPGTPRSPTGDATYGLRETRHVTAAVISTQCRHHRDTFATYQSAQHVALQALKEGSRHDDWVLTLPVALMRSGFLFWLVRPAF